MYADYSPLEDDRNLIDIMKDFTSIVSRLGKIDINNKRLSSLLSDSDILRDDIIAAVKGIRTNTTATMDKFYDKHSVVLADELLTTGAALLVGARTSLSELLGNTETSFDHQHAQYREKIMSKIEENSNTASSLIKTWLAGDYWNLPRPMVSNLAVTISASLDKTGPTKAYAIFRTTTSSTATVETVQAWATEAEKHNEKQPGALQFSYTFRIDSSDVEFWNHKRTVAELGIKELMLPIGMRAPVSEKIKQTFRFGSRKDAEILKEPEFVKADDYHLLTASLQGDRTLVVELAGDISTPETDLFRVTFDVSNLQDSLHYGEEQRPSSTSSRPKIDYLSKADRGTVVTLTDLLQIGEIEKNSDLSKIHLLGAAVLSRIKTLRAPEMVQSRGRLDELKTHDSVSVIPSALLRGDYDALFEFLESVASSFAPFVTRMKEKTTVHGELTLKEELGEGQRKEFSVRIDDLKSQLKDTQYGNRISDAMGL
jgi:hypothetical protein